MADRWQLTDYTLNEGALPYNRQPRLYFNWDKPVLPWLETGIYAEAVRFTHDDINYKYDASAGTDLQYTRNGDRKTKGLNVSGGSRLDLKPYVSFPISGAAWYVTPTLAYRYTAYQLDRGLADGVDGIRGQILRSEGIDPATATPEQLRGNTSPSRSLPIGSIDATRSSIARPGSAASRSCRPLNPACSTCARRTATRTNCRSSIPVTSPSAGASCSATRGIPALIARTMPTS